MNDYIFVNSTNLEEVCINYITKNVPFYDYIFDFHNDLAVVKHNFKYGYINKNGYIEIPIVYDYAYSFYNEIAKVYKNRENYYIDKKGKIIKEKKYEKDNEEKKLIKYCNDRKWGFKNKEGCVIINNDYDNVRNFSESFVAIEKNQKWGFINENGKEIIPCIYDETFDFSEGLVPVKKNQKWGYIDKNGKLVIPYVYDNAHSFKDGVAIAQKNNEQILIYNQKKLNIKLLEQLKKILYVFPNGFYYNPITNEINLDANDYLLENSKQKIKK